MDSDQRILFESDKLRRAVLFRISYVLFFFLIIVSPTYGDDHYQELIDKLEYNIDVGLEAVNLSIIDSLENNNILSTFSCFQQGNLLNKLGVSLYFLNREREAIDVFRNSVLVVWENCPQASESDKANVVYNIGVAYQYTDQPLEGKEYIEESLYKLANANDADPIDLLVKLQGAGSYYLDINDLERAENHFLHALSIAEDNDELVLDRFNILNQLLLLQINFQQYGKGQEYYVELSKLLLRPDIEISKSDKAIMFLNGAKSSFEMNELDEAFYRSELALQELVSAPNDFLIANAEEIKGLVYKMKGDFHRANISFNKVLDIRMRLRDGPYGRAALSHAYENIAELYLAQLQYDDALTYIQKAKEILSYDIDNRENDAILISTDELDLVRVLYIESQLLEDKFSETSRDSFLITSNQIFGVIDQLVTSQLRASLPEYSKVSLYEILSEYLKEGVFSSLQCFEHFQDSSYLEKAYYYCAKSKSLVLQQELLDKAMINKNTNDGSRVIDSLRYKVAELKSNIFETTQEKESLLIELSNTQYAFEEELNNFRLENPQEYQTNFGVFEPLSLDEVQGSLQENEGLVEFVQAGGKWASFWMTPAEILYYHIDSTSLDMVTDYAMSLSHPDSMVSAKNGLRLFESLLKNGLESSDIEHLFIIPDNVLHTLPFDALHINDTGSKFLVEKYVTSYLFSNKWLDDDRQYPLKTMLTYGTTYNRNLSKDLNRRMPGDYKLPPLLRGKEEVQNASSIFGGQTYFNEIATLQSFRDNYSDADLLYLSLHGLVNKEKPDQSCILFDNSDSTDFIFYASDLSAAFLKAKLVVLSSCHSADGKRYNGEGVYGMSRAFISAGVRSIVSSLWNATEGSSSLILYDMMKGLKDGLTIGKALQKAKLSYITQAPPSLRHPYYWSNYIVYGDISNTSSGFIRYWWLTLVIVPLFIFFRKNV